METAAPTIRALELENQRLRADVAELVEAIKPTRGWLKFAYGHVSSVTSEKVKLHLPLIDAVLAKHGA